MKRTADCEDGHVSKLSVDTGGGCLSCIDFKSAAVRLGMQEKKEPLPSMSSLVQEWNQLSLQERELVQGEVHGVASGFSVEETPELIQERMEQMDEEINKIRKKSAYDKAVFLNPSYVKDPDFRIMFLRCENFQPREAAHRIVRFFECRLDFFGPDRFANRLGFLDLDKDDQEYIKSGPIQLLSQKDRSGRAVLWETGTCKGFAQVRSGTFLKRSQPTVACSICLAN